MKTILTLLLTVLIASAQGYKDFAKEMGYETNYNAALKKAKIEQKNLMVLMITNYCPWCSKFEKKTLSDKKVDEAIKAKYIPLIINKEEGGFPPYLNTPLVPTTYFIDPKEQKAYYERMGFVNKTEFLELLKEIE
jgi:thioredoxin-related protein